ncbi:MAG: MBL fold metallo-hydrolase, partial [Candidatus Tectomicrobia bacterium]|nr:MBL fold metallo-hydrolase [Candidatus Tectomicrobia bacterium]
GDQVIFLDAYMDRIPSAATVGLTIDQVDRADWIVVGHSHFDHLYGAERIAKATGAMIIGSYETVRIMAAQGVSTSQLFPVAGGETIRLASEVLVKVFPSQHSCIWSQHRRSESGEVCLGEIGVTYQERMARLEESRATRELLNDEIAAHLQAASQGPLGDGGALVYVFETPRGSLMFQDTSGHWSGILRDLRPDVAILAAAGRGNIDGEPVQGSLAQFVARQADLLRPRRVVLGHHDDWLPGFSNAVDVTPIRDELARWAPRTSLVEMGYMAGYPIFDSL